MGVRRKYLLGLVFLGVALLIQARADDSADPDVLLAQNTTFGQYLTDFKGRSLYLFARDPRESSTCYDQCAENWPPLLFSDKPRPVAGRGLDERLIGSVRRRDGKAQITFGGVPLYYYAKDLKTGEFAGQGAGGNWYLVSPKGEAIKTVVQTLAQPQAQQPAEQAQQQPAQPSAAQTAAINQAKKDAEPLYTTYCASCHGAGGVGGVGPKFTGNPGFLKDAKGVIDQVLGGGQQMPGFGPALDDKKAAALITFVRNSWGNALGLTTEGEVKARRR